MHSSATGVHARRRRNSDLRHSYPSSLQPIKESALVTDDDHVFPEPLPRAHTRRLRPGSAALPDDYNVSLIRLNSTSSSLLGRSIDDICNSNNLLFCREGIRTVRSMPHVARERTARTLPHDIQKTDPLHDLSSATSDSRLRSNLQDQGKGVAVQTGYTFDEDDMLSIASSISKKVSSSKKSKKSLLLGCIPWAR